MFYLIVIISLVVFWVAHTKLDFTSSKSLALQVILGAAILTLCISNILFNWHYFKQYTGVKNYEYHVAYTVWYVTAYGLLSVATILITSLILKWRTNRSI